MEILAMLLGGVSRVKMMRLFLFNNTVVFTLGDLTERLKVKTAEAKKELVQLEKMQDRQRKQTALEFKGQRFRVGLMGEAQQHDDAGGPCRVLDACALFYTPSCVGESVIMAVSVNMMRRVGGDLTLTVEQPARLCWKNRSGATF